MLPDSASFVLVSVALLGGPYTEGMGTYIEINLKEQWSRTKNFSIVAQCQYSYK
jgi:hypothetical protein